MRKVFRGESYNFEIERTYKEETISIDRWKISKIAIKQLHADINTYSRHKKNLIRDLQAKKFSKFASKTRRAFLSN